MPDKQLTPIQEAIKWHKSEKYKIAGNLQQRRFNETTDSTIQFLESLIPIEKQFAKDVWDASAAYQCYSDGPCSEYAPDFDELYKNYSNE